MSDRQIIAATRKIAEDLASPDRPAGWLSRRLKNRISLLQNEMVPKLKRDMDSTGAAAVIRFKIADCLNQCLCLYSTQEEGERAIQASAKWMLEFCDRLEFWTDETSPDDATMPPVAETPPAADQPESRADAEPTEPPDADALDCLTKNQRKLAGFLLERKHWTRADTLLTESGAFSDRASEKAVCRAVERTNTRWADNGITWTIESRDNLEHPQYRINRD